MVGNRVFFAISAQTPIYVALKGKHVGDSIVFNGQQQTIKEIY
jgi:transcription elongation GreA/GreB family factor